MGPTVQALHDTVDGGLAVRGRNRGIGPFLHQVPDHVQAQKPGGNKEGRRAKRSFERIERNASLFDQVSDDLKIPGRRRCP
jgi:hypothetical protein